MAQLFTNLCLTTQRAYAQLLDAALAAEHVRSVADLPGSFYAKTVECRKYWYYQYVEPSGKLRQAYVGPDGEPIHRLMRRRAQPAATAALPPLARSTLALGCAGMIPRQFRVVRRLAEYGFFRAGGVLIGTHAFLAYGNMLGVRWGAQERTQDIDFAHAGKSVALLLPSDIEVQTGAAIASLQMGFLPLAGLGGNSDGTNLVPAEPGFRLDFLTPAHRKGDAAFVHPKLHVTLQPLPFMEFSLESIEQTILFCPEGAVVVNVPDPARFALHKLLVYGERRGTYSAKSSQDLAQAAHVLAYLGEHGKEHLLGVQDDLLSRGKGWEARFTHGVTALRKKYRGFAAADLLAGP